MQVRFCDARMCCRAFSPFALSSLPSSANHIPGAVVNPRVRLTTPSVILRSRLLQEAGTVDARHHADVLVHRSAQLVLPGLSALLLGLLAGLDLELLHQAEP